MEKTVKLSENVVANIVYYFSPEITTPMVDAYLNREDKEKVDNSVWHKKLDLGEITFFTQKKSHQSGLKLEFGAAERLYRALHELGDEAHGETVIFDTYCNEYHY